MSTKLSDLSKTCLETFVPSVKVSSATDCWQPYFAKFGIFTLMHFFSFFLDFLIDVNDKKSFKEKIVKMQSRSQFGALIWSRMWIWRKLMYRSVEIIFQECSFPSEFYCWHIKFAFRIFSYTQISKTNTFNLFKINKTVKMYSSNILRVSI